MTSAAKRISLSACLLIGVALSVACAPRAMRGGDGTENPNMDRAAMSTTLDRDDINYLVAKNLDAMYESRFWKNEIAADLQEPTFAIWPIENATSEHLEDQMRTLLSSIETSLVNTGIVKVTAKERQEALFHEVGLQQGAMFDPATAARLGRMMGAKYYVTGKLTAVDERIQKQRRLQYTLFVQILEIETGLVKFQHESERSKALKG